MAEAIYTTNPSALVARLREHTKLKYMVDCKCGQCQAIPLETLQKTIRTTLFMHRACELMIEGKWDAACKVASAILAEGSPPALTKLEGE